MSESLRMQPVWDANVREKLLTCRLGLRKLTANYDMWVNPPQTVTGTADS